MTPFTPDQLTAILATADQLGRLGFPRLEESYPCPESERDNHVYFAMGVLRGYQELVELAISGLPNDLALEICNEKVEGRVTSLAFHVLNGALPASAILDALGEFLARPGQALDMPGLVSTTIAPVVEEQLSLDQSGVEQQCNVLGEHIGVDARQEVKPASLIPSGQNHLPN